MLQQWKWDFFFIGKVRKSIELFTIFNLSGFNFTSIDTCSRTLFSDNKFSRNHFRFSRSFFNVSVQHNAMQLLSASLTTHNCFIKKTSTKLENEKIYTERHAKKKRVRGSERAIRLCISASENTRRRSLAFDNRFYDITFMIHLSWT